MRIKTTINYPCPNYSDQISSPLIINWINENYSYLPVNLLYFTVQVENSVARSSTPHRSDSEVAIKTSQAFQIGVKLTIREGTEPDLDQLRKLKADIIGWSFPAGANPKDLPAKQRSFPAGANPSDLPAKQRSYPIETETHYLTPQVRFQLDHYWVSIDAFVQALESNRQIRPLVSGRLLGIGGLSGYFYQDSGLVITNSTAIFSDLQYNQIPSELVDYNTYQIPSLDYQTILINIGINGLTTNLKNQIPSLKFQRLYYIGCQVAKNRTDLDYFTNRPDEFKVGEVEYEKVWLFTVDSLSWSDKLISESSVSETLVSESSIPESSQLGDRCLVPLGTTCCIAYNLDRLGLRRQAFPFDWAKMTINQLLSVLEDDFQKWFELTVIKTSDQHPLLLDDWEENKISTLVVQNSYGVKFYHDFNADIALDVQLPTFVEKYTRRINRFRSLQSKSDVEFIIYSHRINPMVVTKIEKFLKGQLIVICSNEIVSDSVRFLKDDGVHPDWKLSNFNWKRHFIEYSLKSDQIV